MGEESLKTEFQTPLKSFALLSLSNLLLQVYGGVYRIYLIRHLGAEPFGLMGMIFPFYRLLVIIITMGLPTAIVRLIAIEQVKNNQAWILRIKKKACYLVTTSALIISLLLFVFSESIGSFLYNDLRTGLILKYFALAITLNSLCLVYRGYFHGLNRIAPLVFSEIAETLGETVFVLLSPFTPLLANNVEASTQLLAKGFLLGEGTCLLALFIYDQIIVRPKLTTSKGPSLRGRKLSGLVKSSLPLMAQQLILSLSKIADGVLLPKLLKEGGLTPSLIAKELGEYWGMATPLIFLPLILFSPLSTLILPATAKATMEKNLSLFFKKIRSMLGFSLLYSLGISLLLLSYGKPLSLVLYKTTSALRYLPFLLPALPFMIMNNLLIPVAEGLGKQGFLLRATLILILIKTGISAAFVPLPTFGLAGAAWGVTISQALFFCLLFKETVFSKVSTSKWFLLFHPKYMSPYKLRNCLIQLFKI
jgi:stage V sporulation protein B